MNDLLRRQTAIQKTMKKFMGRPLVLGKYDCGIVMHYHLKVMGHRLPPIRKYNNEVGAIKALKALGGNNLEEVMDHLLPKGRIAPAAMLMGDAALIPQDPDGAVPVGGALVISVGRKWIGWHPDVPGLAIIEPIIENPFIAAWRV